MGCVPKRKRHRFRSKTSPPLLQFKNHPPKGWFYFSYGLLNVNRMSALNVTLTKNMFDVVFKLISDILIRLRRNLGIIVGVFDIYE